MLQLCKLWKTAQARKPCRCDWANVHMPCQTQLKLMITCSARMPAFLAQAMCTPWTNYWNNDMFLCKLTRSRVLQVSGKVPDRYLSESSRYCSCTHAQRLANFDKMHFGCSSQDSWNHVTDLSQQKQLSCIKKQTVWQSMCKRHAVKQKAMQHGKTVKCVLVTYVTSVQCTYWCQVTPGFRKLASHSVIS